MDDMRVGYSSMGRRRRRGRRKLVSGTCNVCSAPCSSCMHRNNGGFTGSKSDESSDENSHGVVASQCSYNTASEGSNLVNSNRDASSEIAESKEMTRSLGGSRKDKGSKKVVDSCNVLTEGGKGKVKEKSGAENKKDDRNTLVESSTNSDQSERVGKSGENTVSSEPEESNTSAMSESENADSESMELDVKVCDICGDAGREDLLAICSRCSDGAEHTYCMRVMIKKVPEGDWLCEECKFAEQAEKKKIETKGKREAEVNSNAETSNKRHIEKPEAALDAKRQAVEALTGSPKRSVLPRLPTFSRETSFKGLEKTTRKLAHHSSFTIHSSDDTDSTKSTDSQLQSPKGSLFKSNSFNSTSSRPKVRQVDDFMLSRQKTAKENASLDVKEGLSRNAGKMSTRCSDVGNFSCNDSKVKGSKQLKDWSTEANHTASTIDPKLISRGNSSTSYANGARDGKGLQSDGKQGSFVKQARHLNRNRLEDIVASVGDTPTDEKCSSSEQTPSEAKRKDELTNVDGFPRSRELRDTGEKNKDAIGARQRSDLLSGSNPSTTRNIREDINKGNRLRAAVDAALRKKPSFGKNRGLEQSDLPSVPNTDFSCDKALQNLPSKVPVIRDWPVGLQGMQTNLQTDKQTSAVNGKQFMPTGASNDVMAASQSVEPEAPFSSVKPVVIDLPVVSPTIWSTTSAIPEHECIWQGDLEVRKGRNLAAMHSGIQAHLSTLASPKVVEVVNKFPVKVTLNEVHRLSTWPAQFQDIGAKEDHVALFFFAKDIESYEKNYKPLVDNMIQKDLALKGNLEGAELLIFASNQLPQNCQRWNTMYFLWGVFRARKKNCSNPLKNIPVSESCVMPNMGKSFSTREGFRHENPSNIESWTDHASSRMQMCKENAKEDEMRSGIDKEKAFSVSYGHSGMVEETEEGEIGVSPCLKNEKSSGPRTVNSSDMNQKVDLDGLNNEELCEGPVKKKLKTGSGGETEWSMYPRDGYESASRKSCVDPSEEEKIIKKKPDATERIVFPLDLNDGEEDADEMVDNSNRGPLGMVPNLELALGEEKATPSTSVLPFMAGTTSIEEQRSRHSHKPQDEMRNQEDSEASLSLSLSFSSLEKQQQQQQQNQKRQNVNTPMFLFRDFPDKSSS